MTNTNPTVSRDVDDRSITFHFIKSNSFRVMHVSGAYGGITPRAEVHAAIYSERSPIPRQIRQAIAADNQLGEVLEQTQRDGVIREVEADLVMAPDVARSFGQWLIDKADIAEKLVAEDPAVHSTKGSSA